MNCVRYLAFCGVPRQGNTRVVFNSPLLNVHKNYTVAVPLLSGILFAEEAFIRLERLGPDRAARGRARDASNPR